MNKCSNSKCEKHNLKIKGNYCPACGHKSVLVPLFPFAVYVPFSGISIAFCALVILSVIFFVIFPAISGCNAREEKKEVERIAIAQAMPKEWSSLFCSMSIVKEIDRAAVFLNAAKATNNFAAWPPITPEQQSALMETIPQSYESPDSRTKASEVLISKLMEQKK